MAGCGGDCQCKARREAQGPRTPSALTEALAKVVFDGRIIRKALEISKENPNLTADDIVVLVNLARERGELA